MEHKSGVSFAEIMDHINKPGYPAWRYHDLREPRLVYNTEEDRQAAVEGWQPPYEPVTSAPTLKNYFHDLEDFNVRQLLAFVKEEFGVALPKQADKPTLIKAIWHLYHASAKHKGRMVLLAQSVRMNYDETVKEILRKSENFEESEGREIWL